MLAACLACGHDNQRIITMANTTVKKPYSKPGARVVSAPAFDKI